MGNENRLEKNLENFDYFLWINKIPYFKEVRTAKKSKLLYIEGRNEHGETWIIKITNEFNAFIMHNDCNDKWVELDHWFIKYIKTEKEIREIGAIGLYCEFNRRKKQTIFPD